MRNKIVAGNWKMNNDLSQTELLISELKGLTITSDAKVMVAPSFTNLWHGFESLRGTDIEVIAQNMHFAEIGAFTGEVSPSMLKSVGVNTVILGHSERREYFNEDDNLLKQKADAVLSNDMQMIFCFGEKLEDRELGAHFKVIEDQIKNALFHLKNEDWDSIILAYEPVWAIGTGETASPDQAQEMHAFVRGLLSERYDQKLADQISILYGGSVKPENAKEIFSKPDVDGGLIGGAALDASSFMQIVNAV